MLDTCIAEATRVASMRCLAISVVVTSLLIVANANACELSVSTSPVASQVANANSNIQFEMTLKNSGPTPCAVDVEFGAAPSRGRAGESDETDKDPHGHVLTDQQSAGSGFHESVTIDADSTRVIRVQVPRAVAEAGLVASVLSK